MRVAFFSNREKAEPIRQRLGRAGIPASLEGPSVLQKFWFVSSRRAGQRLMVPAECFERAEQLLLDWDAAERALGHAIRCPECGSLRVDYPQFAHNSLLTNLAMGVVAKLGLIQTEYYCEDCHFTWPMEGAKPRRKNHHLAPYYFIEGIEQTSRSDSSSSRGRQAA